MANGQVVVAMLEGAEAQKTKPTRHWPVIILITLLALGIRMVGLGSKGLWIDEADSLYFASQSFSDILYRLCDPHPPGYYVILSGFLSLGRSEFWVRLPSAIADTLSIPLLYILTRELATVFAQPWLDRRTAVLASLLLAVAPLHVWYAQEARMYALVAVLGLCTVYFALRVATRGRTKDILGYLLFTIAALYVDQSSFLPLVVANLLWGGLSFWTRPQREKSSRWHVVRWVGLQMVVGVAFWLWWSQALFPARFEGGTFYQLAMVKLSLERVGLSISLVELRWALAIGVLLVLAITVWASWWLIRHDWIHRLSPALVVGVVALYVLITFVSAVPRVFTLKRLLLSLLPFGLLVSAWAMRKLQLKRWQLSALAVYSLALCGFNVLWVPKEPWREVAATLQQELGPGDVLWVDELALPAFDYYYSGSHERFVWRATHLYELGQVADVTQRGSVGQGHIWVVALVDAYRNLLDYLPVSWKPVWSADWHRVSVRAYTQPASGPNISVSQRDLPSWLLTWPSPVHQLCLDSE